MCKEEPNNTATIASGSKIEKTKSTKTQTNKGLLPPHMVTIKGKLAYLALSHPKDDTLALSISCSIDFTLLLKNLLFLLVHNTQTQQSHIRL
jgi:hypothetical protein